MGSSGAPEQSEPHDGVIPPKHFAPVRMESHKRSARRLHPRRTLCSVLRSHLEPYWSTGEGRTIGEVARQLHEIDAAQRRDHGQQQEHEEGLRKPQVRKRGRQTNGRLRVSGDAGRPLCSLSHNRFTDHIHGHNAVFK